MLTAVSSLEMLGILTLTLGSGLLAKQLASFAASTLFGTPGGGTISEDIAGIRTNRDLWGKGEVRHER